MRHAQIVTLRTGLLVTLWAGLMAFGVIAAAPRLPLWAAWALASLATMAMPLLEHGFSWLKEQQDRRQSQRDAATLEGIRQQLALQAGSEPAARVLMEQVGRLSGARAVRILFREELSPGLGPLQRGEAQGEPEVSLPLGVQERDLGEVSLWGKPKGGALLRHVLHYGALAIHNAMLAEATLDADTRTADARTLRDLQYWLTWTVSNQIVKALGETQGRVGDLKRNLMELGNGPLERDLALIQSRLAELERFVHANLRRGEGTSSA